MNESRALKDAREGLERYKDMYTKNKEKLETLRATKNKWKSLVVTKQKTIARRDATIKELGYKLINATYSEADADMIERLLAKIDKLEKDNVKLRQTHEELSGVLKSHANKRCSRVYTEPVSLADRFIQGKL